MRAGGEGIIAKDTHFLLQTINIEEDISKSAIDQVLTLECRNDLPGNPLSWKVALNNLVAQLLNRKELIIK